MACTIVSLVRAPFDVMMSRGELVDLTHIHARYYGTSLAAVQRVTEQPRICLLDLNVDGIEKCAM